MKRSGRRENILLNINVIIFCCFAFLSFFGKVTKFGIAGHTFGLSFYISIIAFPLFLISYIVSLRKRCNIDFYIYNLVLLVSVLLFSSLGMSYILYPSKSGLFGTNPFKVWALNSAKYLYDLFGIIYCIYFLSVIKRKTVKLVCIIFFWLWVFVGFVQIIVYKANSPTLNNIYDSLNFLGVLQSTQTMARIIQNYGYMRIAIFGSEPASNCVVIFCFIVPILCYKFFESRKNKNSFFSKVRLYVATIITIVFAVFAKSSSILVAGIFFVIALYFIFMSLKNIKSRTKGIVTIAGVVAIGISFLVLVLTSKNGNIFLKLFNTQDYSTQYRYSTIWNDIVIFIKSSIFGVGDGNQGYYYFENIVGTWMSNNVETQASLRGENGLLGGGPLVPSFISGYGLLGIIMLCITFKKYFVHVNNTNGFFKGLAKYLIIASMCTFALLSIATTNIHFNASAYLVIALPTIFSASNVINKHVYDYLEIEI